MAYRVRCFRAALSLSVCVCSQVDYKDLGGLALVQVWDVRGPTFVRQDWRSGDRFPPKLALPSEKCDTLEKMLFNVALITPFATQCRDWFTSMSGSTTRTQRGMIGGVRLLPAKCFARGDTISPLP